MFDIAYECELSLLVFSDLKESLWNLIPRDLSRPFSGLVEMMNFERAYCAYSYWSIMFGTHGGF